MLLVPITFFSFCWVDYPLEGFTFLTEQMWFKLPVSYWKVDHGRRIDLFWFLFLVGRICPLVQKHILWPLLKRKTFYYGWICNVVSRWAQLVSFLCSVQLSRVVIYRFKVIRMKCSLKWRSDINYGELHCGSVDSSLVFFKRKCESFDWSAYFLPLFFVFKCPEGPV